MALPEYSLLVPKMLPFVRHLADRWLQDSELAARVAHEVLVSSYRDYQRCRHLSIDEYRLRVFRMCERRCRRAAGKRGGIPSAVEADTSLFLSLRAQGYGYDEIAEIAGKRVGWAYATARALSGCAVGGRG